MTCIRYGNFCGKLECSEVTFFFLGLGPISVVTFLTFIFFYFSSADISITLRNQGRDAFKPEVYGSSIIVNQHINLDGSRSYRLKSKSG